MNRRVNLGELLHECADRYGSQVCITQAETGDRLSYAELDIRASRIAHGLLQHFPDSSNFLAIMLENSIDYLALTYALKKINRVEVSVNRAFRGPALSRMINLTKSDSIVTSADHLCALEAIIDDLTHVKNLIITDDVDAASKRFPHLRVCAFDDLLSKKDRHIQSRAKDTDLATIMFTSGTTGVSKGCMLSHRYAVRTAENMIEPFRLNASDINYTPYPLSHIGPAYYDILSSLIIGGQSIIRDGFSLSTFWPEVSRYQVTWFMCLGSVQQLLYAAPQCEAEKNHSVTRCWATPAPVPKEDFEQRFGLHLLPGGGYGSTDAGWVVVPQWDHPGGKVLPQFDIAIVDENDDPVPAGQDGQLLVRPNEPGVMSDGYFGMPDKTLESRRNLWFHTGDIGCIDEDGLFYFRCRMAERIRVRGEMINGFEVEEGALLHPAIEDAAAIGVPATLGEEDVHLFVTLKPGAQITTEQLQQHCRETMAKFMVPAAITILKEMPRTPTGKPEKGRLRELFNQTG